MKSVFTDFPKQKGKTFREIFMVFCIESSERKIQRASSKEIFRLAWGFLAQKREGEAFFRLIF
jgi:hypothetical protein